MDVVDRTVVVVVLLLNVRNTRLSPSGPVSVVATFEVVDAAVAPEICSPSMSWPVVDKPVAATDIVAVVEIMNATSSRRDTALTLPLTSANRQVPTICGGVAADAKEVLHRGLEHSLDRSAMPLHIFLAPFSVSRRLGARRSPFFTFNARLNTNTAASQTRFAINHDLRRDDRKAWGSTTQQHHTTLFGNSLPGRPDRDAGR
uniref:Putative secreted protein n=1 Tax=Anopheles darlingi TaxID=43151 RepID=A0A2M4DAR2_ANODA